MSTRRWHEVTEYLAPTGQLADQFWQWAARNPKTGKLTVAYDRKYGDAQQTGAMDITLRRRNAHHVRVTNRTLPPIQEFLPEAGAGTGNFLGDYIGGRRVGRGRPPGLDRHPHPVFSPSTGGDVRELVRAGQGSDIYSRSLPGNHRPGNQSTRSTTAASGKSTSPTW